MNKRVFSAFVFCLLLSISLPHLVQASGAKVCDFALNEPGAETSDISSFVSEAIQQSFVFRYDQMQDHREKIDAYFTSDAQEKFWGGMEKSGVLDKFDTHKKLTNITHVGQPLFLSSEVEDGAYVWNFEVYVIQTHKSELAKPVSINKKLIELKVVRTPCEQNDRGYVVQDIVFHNEPEYEVRKFFEHIFNFEDLSVRAQARGIPMFSDDGISTFHEEMARAGFTSRTSMKTDVSGELTYLYRHAKTQEGMAFLKDRGFDDSTMRYYLPISVQQDPEPLHFCVLLSLGSVRYTYQSVVHDFYVHEIPSDIGSCENYMDSIKLTKPILYKGPTPIEKMQLNIMNWLFR